MTGHVIIAPEQAADIAAIRAIHTAAFGQPAEADLVDALRLGGWAEISLVAKGLKEALGHVLFSRLEASMRAVALAPLAVLPDRQGSGIGSALVYDGLRSAAEQGWEAVFVLGDPAYYERFGFSREAARGYDSIYAGDNFMMLELRPGSARPGAIRYPPPFAGLE